MLSPARASIIASRLHWNQGVGRRIALRRIAVVFHPTTLAVPPRLWFYVLPASLKDSGQKPNGKKKRF